STSAATYPHSGQGRLSTQVQSLVSGTIGMGASLGDAPPEGKANTSPRRRTAQLPQSAARGLAAASHSPVRPTSARELVTGPASTGVSVETAGVTGRPSLQRPIVDRSASQPAPSNEHDSSASLMR